MVALIANEQNLMSQKNETDFMRWDEWKLSKVFTVTLSQLEASIENK